MACLTREQLASLANGTLSEPEAAAAHSHLASCEGCRKRFEAEGAATVTVAPGSPARAAAKAPELARGTAIGRYLVHARVGAGGMGEVYAAVDPELGRKVAIKLVSARGEGSSGGGSAGQLRLLREAQAMARLSHPSVVTVFDVGTYGGGVFLAMELVEGQTLRQWLEQEPRPRDAVVKRFVEAGQGLAAAHAAGLVHRDFKPDNVLIDTRGRARVTDFGLARALRAPERGGGSADEPRLSDHLGDELTGAGQAPGTPAFMSPEQLDGAGVDARSDQFSFCVALYRALYHAPPFAGQGSVLMQNVHQGRLAEPPEGARVPAWLRASVLKGLARSPGERFASMDLLLQALETDPAAARGALARKVGLGLALVAGALGAFAWVDSRSQVCTGGAAKLAAVWSPSSRSALETAFRATQQSYAGAAAKAVAQELDARGAQWVASYTDACEATHARREQSEAVLELRLRCLDDRLTELKALLDVFSRADEKMVRRAMQAVAGLETTWACSDVASLSLPVRPPSDPGRRAKVDALRDKLAGPRAQYLAGRFQEGLDAISAVRAEIDAESGLPLVAEERLVEGELLREAGETKRAEAALLEAVAAAEGGKHDAARARALIALTSTALAAGKTEAGEQWGQIADGLIQRLGQPDELVGGLWTTLGALADSQGNNALAMSRYERSLAARQRAFGADSYLVGFTLNNLGVTAMNLGDFKKASGALERALALQRAGLGEGHPALGAPLTNLGSLRVREGNAKAGLELHEEAEALALRALGATHPQVGIALANEGDALVALERWGEAEQRARKALEIFDARFPQGHFAHVYVLTTLGEALAGLQRHAEAVVALERGLEVLATHPSPPEVGARLRLALARALVASGGDRSRALQLAEKARQELPAATGDPALRAAIEALVKSLPRAPAGR